MRHLFGKEHKERKSMKLVKKLQQEEDENWHVEQQRRLEQEEKDAAFARELQEQIASDEPSINTDGAYTTTIDLPSPSISPVLASPSPISSSPPPIPAKPTAYHSGSSSSSSASSSNTDQQRPRRQATPLSYNDASSSSSTSQRAIPPPPYQNGQPPLPPRERTVSQLSQYNLPLSQPSPSAREPDAYHASPNPVAAHPSYYSGTAQHVQHRDPAMLIIPQENQPETTPTAFNNSFYPPTTMAMPEPEPVRNTSLQHSATPPYDPSTHSTSAAAAAPVCQPVYIPTPPASSSSSYHSLAGTSNTSTGTTFVGHAPPKMATSATEPPHSQQQPTTMKPDANLGKENKRDSRSTFTNGTSMIHQPTTTTVNEDRMEESDDDDDNGSMFWECNDGRMMASTPPTTATTTHDNGDKTSITRQATRNGKHLAATNAMDEDGSGSDGDDIAIDPFDITENDHVVIHQHISTTRSMDNNDDDPFADIFAVEQPSESANYFQMNTHLPTTANVHDPLLATTKSWRSSSAAETPPPPASVCQYPIHHDATDNDLISLDDDDIQQVVPTNVLRAGAPPNIQLMMNQVTEEVPSNEFGYYQHQTTLPGGEKEEVDDSLMKNVPKLPKTHPDHRHITVPSVVENERVWIRVHPTDTGKSLASRIHIVATYKTRKIISIKTDKGRSIPLDDTPVFQDWAGVVQLEDGAPWHVKWTAMDNNPWEGPKEFLRYLKDSMRLSHD